jgi:predicted ferric reductase
MGFGGDFVIKTPDGPGIHAFIAGGVGITPLLGQLNNLAVEKLRLIWILKLEDIDFVVDVFQRHPQLSTSTTIFFTGIPADDVTRLDEKVLAQIETIKNSGAQVSIKRPESQDILAYKAEIWYVCAANLLRKQLLAWLDGRVVVMESFDF